MPQHYLKHHVSPWGAHIFLVFFTLICASSRLVRQKLGFNKQGANFLDGDSLSSHGLLSSYTLYQLNQLVTKYLRLGIYKQQNWFFTVLDTIQDWDASMVR